MASLKSRFKSKRDQIGKAIGQKKAAAYKFTSARKAALMKAVKASASARKSQIGNAITNSKKKVRSFNAQTGGAGNAKSVAKIKANRVFNKLTGSKTSALKKRQMAKKKIAAAKQKISVAKSSAKRKISVAKSSTKRAVSSAQIKANRVANKLTGSKTSALKKRQMAKKGVASAKKSIANSTTARFLKDPGKAVSYTKKAASKKVNSVVSKARQTVASTKAKGIALSRSKLKTKKKQVRTKTRGSLTPNGMKDTKGNNIHPAKLASRVDGVLTFAKAKYRTGKYTKTKKKQVRTKTRGSF